jgi:hypothetical protein
MRSPTIASLALGVLVALSVTHCKKSSDNVEMTPAKTTSAAVQSVTNPATPVATAIAPAPTPTSERQALRPIPASFEGAAKAEVKNAVGIGCEAVTKDGWLQLWCHKKNSTGGKPVHAVFSSAEEAAASRGEPLPSAWPTPNASGKPALSASATATSTSAAIPSASASGDADAGAPEFTVEAEEKGDLRVLVPWLPGYATKVRIDWSDVSYDLIVDSAQGELKRPENLALRKACAELTRKADDLVAVMKKANASDVKGMPKFGRCQLAGTGAWAVSLDSLNASGEGSTRKLNAQLSAVHLDEQAHAARAPLAEFSFAPEGLSLPTPMIFDFDADGSHEMIVRYDLLALPEGLTAPTNAPPTVFTFKSDKVAPFAVGDLAAGGFSVEQLDSDMRPDVADYGPFVAWLPKTCGGAQCPKRISGPRFFLQATADGKFDRQGAAALAALKRACPSKPTNVVAAGAQGVNLETTAERVGCARAWQVDSASITQQLTDAKSKLCGAADTCPALSTLQSWASKIAPTTL